MEKSKSTSASERPLWVCVSRSFVSNRFFNPGDLLRRKACPGMSFRPFNPEKDRIGAAKSIATDALDDFTSTL